VAVDYNRPPSPPFGERLAQLPLSSKILLPAALVFLIDSFLPWQRACIEDLGCASASGWHGVGIIAALCAAALLVLEGLRLAGIRLPIEPRIDAFIVAGLAGGVLLFTIIKLLVDDFRGYGLWIGLVVAAVLVAGASLRVGEAGRGRSSAPAYPAPGYAPPPPGYAPPAPGYTPGAQAPSPAAEVGGGYRLVIVRSPAIAAGSRLQLGGQPATVGRASDNTVPLGADGFASGRHARFEIVGDQLSIVDLGSRNGTYVNGQAIGGPTLLREGDVVRIGETEIRIER
jgi:hypothetical protein